MDPADLVATAGDFNAVVDTAELGIAQQILDQNKKALALRPAVLSSHSAAPVYVRLQELQETFEKQLKQQTETSQRKLRELCEQQKSDYAALYEKEKSRLLKVLK